MNATDRPSPENRAWIAAAVIACLFCGLVLWCIVGVTGYFRLSSETAALRTSVMRAVPGDWNKTIALNVGWFTTGIVRVGSRLFSLPPEPRAALSALHGAEVGVYRLGHAVALSDQGAALKAADQAMTSRGWDRIVGVSQDADLVAVYLPKRKSASSRVKCCVLVFHDRELIVSSIRGNLEPLMELANNHFDLNELKRQMR
jgi:hypothetical protein